MLHQKETLTSQQLCKEQCQSYTPYGTRKHNQTCN